MADYQSALIQGLRQGGAGEAGNPGVRFLPNQANGLPLNRNFSMLRQGLINNPEALQMPAYVPQPFDGGGGDGGRGGYVPDRGLQLDLPVLDQLESEVPDYTEDLWPPVDESVAESSPVPEPAPSEFYDLPPMDEPVAESFPVPDPVVPEIIDLPPLPDEPPQPEPQEPPQGELEVGPPGDSQPARDAIDQIGDITDVGSPLDEWEWIELPEPEIPLPEIPAASFSVSDADLMNMLMGLDDMDVSYMDF